MEKVIVAIKTFDGEEEHIDGHLVSENEVDLELSDPPKENEISHIRIYRKGPTSYIQE